MDYQYIDLDYTGTSTGSETQPWKGASGTDGFIDNNSSSWTDDITVYVKGVTTYLEANEWDLGTDKCDMNGYALFVKPWPGASQECAIDQWHTDRYTIDSGIHMEQPNIYFENLQCTNTDAGSGTYPFFVRARNYTGTCGLFRCRVQGVPPAITENRLIQIAAGTGVILEVDECIIAGNNSGTNNQGYACYDITGTNTLRVRNCTIEGWRRGTRNCFVENSAVFDSLTEDNYTPDLEDYCATDDGNGTNPVSPSGSDWDNELVDYANGDYTIVETGNMYGGGKDMSTYYTIDLSGETIVNDSIGADDFATAPTTEGKNLLLLGVGA
jgi:hypothetical protein